jgi:dihydropyrimidinase
MIDPHAENIEIVWRLRAEAAGATEPPLQVWNGIRPPFVEAEAEQRAAYLAGVAGASMYAVHVSSREALDVLVDARRRHPDVYLETCPHYLTHDVDSDLGLRGKVNPPLRRADVREALWGAVPTGTIDVVGSDHVPRHHSKKSGDIWKASAGFPGLQSLLPVLLSEGHLRRGIPLERVVDTVTARPAQLFGLYPRKGVLAVGADADVALVDLNAPSTIQAASQLSAAGYSIYEGWELKCCVVHTLVRGAFALRDGQLVDGARGRFLRRPHSGATALAGGETQ